eukprot:TRINITY_DN44177_c0_g1_i1.p1 TRINITY_DN44177_c0_g1~~TRINITY_DN44177_c0_g1_i1.p1  ORF type:complete len:114 (+),score=18.66 TRINITY_DN44177_c0_g1_i1:26-343(+)
MTWCGCVLRDGDEPQVVFRKRLLMNMCGITICLSVYASIQQGGYLFVMMVPGVIGCMVLMIDLMTRRTLRNTVTEWMLYTLSIVVFGQDWLGARSLRNRIAGCDS